MKKENETVGNPLHWFGDLYLGGSAGGKFILYNSKTTIYLKSKSYADALKEARQYEQKDKKEK